MPYSRALLPLFLLPFCAAANLTSVPVMLPTSKQVHVSTVSGLVSALGSASKGQTIMLADGTYDLSRVWPLRIRTDSVYLYGASRNPTKVILKGGGFTSSNTNEELIKIEAVGVRLAYFTLRDGRANGVKIQTGGNHRLFIHNVYFIDICERSIKGPDVAISKNGVVEYCLFQQNTPITRSIPNIRENGDYIAGMDMMKIEGWYIHGNEFRNIRGMNGGGRAGIFLWKGCKNITIERNLFIGCDRAISFGNPSSSDVDMDGGIIRNNFIVAGKGISMEICNSTRSTIAYNTVYSTNLGYSRTVFFYNNRAGNVLKNNLVLGKLSIQGGSSPDAAGNLFATTASQTANWFRNPSTGDLHLNSGATGAIDKAVVLSSVPTDIDGGTRPAKPDIGADEYGVSNGPLFKVGEEAATSIMQPQSAGAAGAMAPRRGASMDFRLDASWFGADGRLQESK